MVYDTVTIDLEEFGNKEIGMMIGLLTAWQVSGLPNDFERDGIKIMLNKDLGYVFLTNSDYNESAKPLLPADSKLPTKKSLFYRVLYHTIAHQL